MTISGKPSDGENTPSGVNAIVTQNGLDVNRKTDFLEQSPNTETGPQPLTRYYMRNRLLVEPRDPDVSWVGEKQPPAKTSISEENYRLKRYYAQHLAAKILWERSGELIGYDEDLTLERQKLFRTTTCMRRRSGVNGTGGTGVVSIRKSVKHGKAFYAGLCTCGSFWACPVCSAKLQSRRAVEILKLFRYAYDRQVKQIAMLTLTFPHKISDSLAGIEEKHTKAIKIFRNYNNTRYASGLIKFKEDIGYEGVVKALELTYGKDNGWHLHTHELWIIEWFDENPDREATIKQYLLDRWEHACKKVGLLTLDGTIKENEWKLKHFREHSVDIVFRCKDSEYLAKQNGDNDKTWGAEKEITGGAVKVAHNGGRALFKILLDAENNDADKRLYVEAVEALRGKSQLVWSQGLKGRVGVEEKTDQQLLDEIQDVADLLVLLNDEQWRLVVKNHFRGELLDLTEQKGFDGVREWFESNGLKLDAPDERTVAADKAKQEREIAKRREKYERKVAEGKIKVVTFDDGIKEFYCPDCGCRMVSRIATTGKRAGQIFLGCSDFPNCKYTADILDPDQGAGKTTKPAHD